MTGQTELFAVRMANRQAFAEKLFALWDRGVAVLPLDPLAPAAVQTQTLSRFHPSRLVTDDGEQALADPAPVDAGTALVIATSGTTGAPKGVVLSHSAIDHAARAGVAKLGASSDDRWLCCLPFNHIAGLMTLVRSHLMDTPPLITDSFDPGSFGPKSPAILTSLVPTMLKRLLDANVDLSNYPAILLGGGPIPKDLVDRAEAFGYRIVTTYGMTETCGGCVYDGHPLAGVEIKTNNEQRILIRGPILMTGYHLDPDLTNDSLRDGWLYSADRGEITADGTVAIAGRLDEAIVSGGENISLTEVETLLTAHPGIKEAAALGLPSPQWGQIVVAAVVVSSDPAPNLEELRDYIATQTDRFKAPKQIIQVGNLPKTATGKIDRAHLAELFETG